MKMLPTLSLLVFAAEAVAQTVLTPLDYRVEFTGTSRVTGASAQTNPTRLGYLKEGVYVLHVMRVTNIIEFKGGRFRQLILSSSSNRGTNSYLQSGAYTTNAGMVNFVVPRPPSGGRTRTSTLFITNEYTCLEFKGQTELWSPEALKMWNEKRVYPFGIYEATDRKLEDFIEGK